MARVRLDPITLVLVIAVLAALALVGINETGHRQSMRALTEIHEAQRIRFALNQTLQGILDAETGQRGYLLTGETAYRAPYDSAVRDVNAQLALLRTLYAELPVEREQLSTMASHISRKFSEMDVTIRLREKATEDAWRFVIGTDVGREEMDAIRAQATTLIAASNRLIDSGQAQIARSLQFSRAGIALVAFAGLVAFWLYLRQTHALRQVSERQQEVLQRERDALEGQVRERTASLRELATHLQQVQETERGYLARELHDELGSLLTAAKLDVARLNSRLAGSPDAVQRLKHLTELLNSGIALKRRIIEDLRPSSLSNLGLVASLEILGREFAERSGMRIEMLLEPVSLTDERQLTVFRMVQESLTNLGKYAQATEGTIVLHNHGTHIEIEVSDNGQGFDPGQVRPATHGLAGMRHRVEAAGGRLTVSSTPGSGTVLRATLPADTAGGATTPALTGA